VCKTWVKNVVNKIGSMEELTKVLSILERIMYFQDCPLDEEHVLGVYRDVGNQFPQCTLLHCILKRTSVA
jgi:hypothetical protein